MSYAIRNDRQGLRAVNGPADVGADEYYSDVPIELVPVVTTANVDSERDRRLESGFVFRGVKFQSKEKDRENITGAALLASIAMVNGAKVGDLRWSDPDSDFVWIAMDNSEVPMDAPTVVEFGTAMAKRKQELIYAGRRIKDMPAIPTDYSDDKWWP